MMPECGNGIFGGGLPVGVGGGADGGVTDRRRIEGEQRVRRQAKVVEGGEFHDEVVRVLAVADGFAAGGLALLEELGIIAA